MGFTLVVLLIILYNVVLTYEAGNKILRATIQTKIAERCFPVH